jgi:outer membrane protein TolC
MDQRERRDEGREYDLNLGYSVRLGFTFPLVNADRLDVNRRKLALMDSEARYKDLVKDADDDMEDLVRKLRTLLRSYELLTAREEAVNAESSLKAYLSVEGIDPLVLLRTQEAILKARIDREQIRYDIYRKFIEVMDVTGALSREPLRNVLAGPVKPTD